MKVINLLRADGSIIINKKLAHAVGIDSAIMYSELISKHYYFETREQLTDDGYFFNTVDNMEVDTMLSRHRQTKSINHLVKLGLIKNENRGIPQKRYFKIVDNDELLLQTLETGQLLKNRLTEKRKADALVIKNRTSNNTNSNITKVNNTKSNKRDIITSSDVYSFTYYNFKYRQKYKREHPTVKLEQLNNLEATFLEIRDRLNFGNEEMNEIIDKYFEDLSDDNNGMIFSFVGRSYLDSPILRYRDSIEA